MNKVFALLFLFVGAAVFLRCKSTCKDTAEYWVDDTKEQDSTHYYQVELGKYLFYDPILSRDSSVSCATCHKQELAFTDGLPKGIGIRDQEVTRNSPTLANVGNRPYLLLDGVNPSLEAQVLVPIAEHKEFDFHPLLIVDRLNKNPKYVEWSKKGFGTEITQFVFTKAIAEFERTLVSNSSPYDQYKAGNKEALNEAEKRGMDLFFNQLYCAECHNGNDFTDDRFTNNGLYVEYADTGRMRLTDLEKDRAIFKVPTLRNIAVTAPYMHDGSISTLEAVLDHYSQGGKSHPSKGEEIVPFTLTLAERNDLIAFLNALTDQKFLTDPALNIPESP